MNTIQVQPNTLERHDPWYLDFSYSIIKYTLGTLIRLIWVKEVKGLEHIPKDGSVIVAFNHQSYFDFLTFIAVCPRHIHFLSAEKFFSHAVWGPLVKLTGQIKVNRKDRDKHDLHTTVYSHLHSGKIIGIFPEGTRADHPEEMLHAFTGVAKYAVKGKVPVIPVGIRGAYEVMSRNDVIPRFKKIIKITVGQPIHFNHDDVQSLEEKHYRELTDKIMLEISYLSGKKYLHVGKMER